MYRISLNVALSALELDSWRVLSEKSKLCWALPLTENLVFFKVCLLSFFLPPGKG